MRIASRMGRARLTMNIRRPVRISNDADRPANPFMQRGYARLALQVNPPTKRKHTLRHSRYLSLRKPCCSYITRCKFNTQFDYCERLVPSDISPSIPKNLHPLAWSLRRLSEGAEVQKPDHRKEVSRLPHPVGSLGRFSLHAKPGIQCLALLLISRFSRRWKRRGSGPRGSW